MRANEDLWDKLSRLPKPLHPIIPSELTEDINAERKKRQIIISTLSAKTEVNMDMTRNIIYGMLKRINYSVIRVCNYLEINITDYIDDIVIDMKK